MKQRFTIVGKDGRYFFGRTTMSIPHHSYEVSILERIIELADK